MTINLELQNRVARLAVLLLAVAASGLLAMIVFSRFVIGTLADERFMLDREWLLAGTSYLPDSPRLNARLAEVELFAADPDLSRADRAATRAVELSPADYRWRLILASVKEAEGDRAAAEDALREARRLAPNDRDVHYRLANVLLREGKLAPAIDEFRVAIDKNPQALPVTLDLIWRVTRGNVEAVETVAGNDPRRRLQLAQFLARQSRVVEAATVFRTVERSARLASVESAQLINALIAAGSTSVARELWVSMIGEGRETGSLIYNGGFESDILKNFSQFDWTLGASEYAAVRIDRAVHHSGERALKIEFIGRDTTTLNEEIRQLVVVRPGARYRIECYIKTDRLETPEGPRLVVTDRAGNWLASSETIAEGTSDWQPVSLTFVAPAVAEGASAVYVSVKRRPKYAYDNPTKGTVWLDDFTMQEE
ncbi:MAG TPA: tetratricopeptide repeat protein [Blastocatellia bacterium]|nr:tetratricopeptide repeat protein [Blastocatellia bacterium]